MPPHVFVDADDLDPSKRCGSAINTRRPSASTSSLAVFHETPNPSAILATIRCWQTTAVNAHRRPQRDCRARGSVAADVSCRHTCPQLSQRYQRTVTSRIVGRQPNGSCASRRVVESRGRPCPLQRRTSRHPPRSGRPELHDRAPGTARSLVNRARPAGRNVVRSGVTKVASAMSRSFRWTA